MKSQWEFGELFPAEAIRKVLTVSEVTGSIRRVLEKEVGKVSVMGEMSNVRLQSSGHVYFTIKDANAQLACVMFRTEAQAVDRTVLADGQKVVVEGEITVYEARGQYQLRASSVQLYGVGALQAAFERLKQKLQAEGLFDQSHKRLLPRYPRRIGLVTSLTGAAIRDVLHAVARRDPSLEVVLAACRVQGPGAGQEIAAALHTLNDWARESSTPLDAILLTRGGGSLEDLWAFNEEIVARAIYASEIPVISAVGHEIDFTISDFVADLRAATPTAGAELLTEGVFSARPFLAAAHQRLLELAAQGLENRREMLRQELRHLARRHPKRRLQDQAQRVDALSGSLDRCVRHHFSRQAVRVRGVLDRLARVRPERLLHQWRERLAAASERFVRVARHRLEVRLRRLERAQTRLHLLSPRQVLERGYSITVHAGSGKILLSPSQVRPGERIKTVLSAGEISSVVTTPEA